MSRPFIRIHNTATNEIIDREMNDDEFAQYEADLIAYENQKIQETAKIEAKAELLARLGITAEEAQLLLS
jgi:hypothetical protein